MFNFADIYYILWFIYYFCYAVNEWMNIMYVKDCTGITDCTENDENCTENDVKVVQLVRAKEKYP